MRYFHSIIICTIAILTLLSGTGFACSCQPPDEPLMAFEKSSVVFVGKAIDKTLVVEGGQREFDYRFQVLRQLKSAPKDELVVRSGSSGGGLCGYPFTVGEEYLIYAVGGETPYTDICTRTRKLENAAGDLQELDSVNKKTSKE